MAASLGELKKMRADNLARNAEDAAKIKRRTATIEQLDKEIEATAAKMRAELEAD